MRPAFNVFNQLMNILKDIDKPKYQVMFKGLIHNISDDYQQYSLDVDQFKIIQLMRQRELRNETFEQLK